MNSGQPRGDFGTEADAGLAELRADQAASERRDRRWRAEADRYDLTVESALAGSIGSQVRLDLAGGTTVRGSLTAVGIDVARVDADGWRWWVPLAAIDMCSARSLANGSIDEVDDATLSELCEDLAGDSESVTVLTRAAATLSVRVLASGAALVLADDAGLESVLRWESIAAIRLRDASAPRRPR